MIEFKHFHSYHTDHIDPESPEAWSQIQEVINEHPLAFVSFNYERMAPGVVRVSVNFLDISCVIVLQTDEHDVIDYFKDKVKL